MFLLKNKTGCGVCYGFLQNVSELLTDFWSFRQTSESLRNTDSEHKSTKPKSDQIHLELTVS